MITRRKMLITSILSMVFLIGCAHKLSLPPSEAQRAKFRTIGIVYGSYVPELNYDTFAKSLLSGAGKGALEGFFLGAKAMGSANSGPLAIILLPFMAAIGAAVGSIVGVEAAVPREEAEKIEAAIKGALGELEIQKTMARSLFKNCSTLSDYGFGLLDRQGPVSPDQKPDYKILKEQGIDTVLEVSVKGLGFEGGKGNNPSISFFMNVQIRLLSLIDRTEVFVHEFKYTSPPRPFTHWSYNNGQRLREEFDLCYGTLSEKITDELFLLYPMPSKR